MEWLDKIPLSMLIVISILMLLAPFTPEPHLWEKYKMLRAGTLTRPIDIFDVFWHLLPTIILIAKLLRTYR
jgi:hypothetical protein